MAATLFGLLGAVSVRTLTGDGYRTGREQEEPDAETDDDFSADFLRLVYATGNDEPDADTDDLSAAFLGLLYTPGNKGPVLT